MAEEETSKTTSISPTASEQLTRRAFLVRAVATAAVALGTPALLTACDEEVGFGILFMMNVQSIQDRKNSITLVSGKRTIVRVFPITNQGSGDTTNITGMLSIHSGDSESGTLLKTISPLNGPISSRSGPKIDPDQPDHSLDFEIPLSLITGQDLTVRADLTGSSGTKASYLDTMEFQTISKMETLAPVLITPTAYTTTAPTMADYMAVLNGALKRLPVPLNRYTLRSPTSWTTNRAMTSSDDFYWLNTDLAWHFFNIFGSDFPTGIVPPPPSFPSSTRTLGMFYSGLEGSVAAFCVGATVDLATAETTFAHEFSHHYGLGHAAGCLSPDGVDPDLPQTTDMTGMDVFTHTIMKKGTNELMSYCSSPHWPSSITYDKLLKGVS